MLGIFSGSDSVLIWSEFRHHWEVVLIWSDRQSHRCLLQRNVGCSGNHVPLENHSHNPSVSWSPPTPRPLWWGQASPQPSGPGLLFFMSAARANAEVRNCISPSPTTLTRNALLIACAQWALAGGEFPFSLVSLTFRMIFLVWTKFFF